MLNTPFCPGSLAAMTPVDIDRRAWRRSRRRSRRLGLVPVVALVASLMVSAVWAPCSASAQGQGQDRGHNRPQDSGAPAILIADQVWMETRDRIVAEGHVEAVQGETRVQASRIVYDRATGELILDGPIVLTRGQDEVILGDSAQLDRGLRNGLIHGARLVLDQQLQIAAARMDRSDGRYAQMTRVTASSCHVCGNHKPLWQIRASRVVHDKEAKQLYFDDARFQVMGASVFYLPRLRMPDPTQTRATGFLIPSIKQSSLLATGIRMPYFIKLGDHRDLTLTPYISAKTRTLEFRYRQAFARGRISFDGAISQDDLLPGRTRAYLHGVGQFNLRNDFVLSFDAIAFGDDSYLNNYSYSSADRHQSRITLHRFRRDEFIEAELAHYRTLRVTEDNATIPALVGDATYEKRIFPRFGELRLKAQSHSHVRYSDLNIDSADSDLITDGRDVTRINAGVLWTNTWTLPGGLRAQTLASVEFDSFRTEQDAALPTTQSGFSPAASVTLRWPFSRAERSGAIQIIEPVAMVGWTGGKALNVANDESRRVEFDEGNLLSLSRFPGEDRRERGLQAALGIGWTRIDPTGWEGRLTLGTVLRETANPDFYQASGLQGATSDLLISGQFKNGDLALFARGLFNNDLDVNKAEARAFWHRGRYSVAANYVWLSSDPVVGRSNTVSEWSFTSGVDLGTFWNASVSGRYDIATDKPISAGLGLNYRNECVDVTVSASRRFASSTIVTPVTDFSFAVSLRGFSANTGQDKISRNCR